MVRYNINSRQDKNTPHNSVKGEHVYRLDQLQILKHNNFDGLDQS